MRLIDVDSLIESYYRPQDELIKRGLWQKNMRELELYQCEICNTQFNDKKKAEECEMSHCKITNVVPKRWRAREKYPDRIIIEFSDGEEICYIK